MKRINPRVAIVGVAVAAVGLGATVAVIGHASSPSTSAGAASTAIGATASAGTGGGGRGAAVPTPGVTPPPAASLLTPSSRAKFVKYVGVALPAGPAGLAAFTEATGTNPDISEQFANFGQPFPATGANQALGQGAYTLISWQSEKLPLTQIADGAEDSYLRQFATAVKAFGWPVMVDLDHEFNGNWYPWGTQAVTPEQFVAAWRHVHDVFAAAGAANVLWVWSPNVVNPVPDVDLAAYWPGAQYVDVVGIVGYFTGQLGEDSYADLFGRTEKTVDAFADKPFLITEAGAEQGPDKAAWITDLIDGVRGDARMLGFVYFDEGDAQHKRADWTIEDSQAAVTAWRSAVSALTVAPLAGG